MQTMIGEEPKLENMAGAAPELSVAIAGGSSKNYTLTRQLLTIGRVEDNDIVVPSQIVSSQHARLERTDGGYNLVVATEAKNPILFEGRPLEGGSRILHHGDTLQDRQPGSGHDGHHELYSSRGSVTGN